MSPLRIICLVGLTFVPPAVAGAQQSGRAASPETQVAQASDTTFSQGNPGMGFYLDGKAGLNTDYGFTFFSASDGAMPWSPSNLRIASALPPATFHVGGSQPRARPLSATGAPGKPLHH